MIDIVLRKNNIKSSKGYGKYFAHVAKRDNIELAQFSEKIQKNCSLKESDVKAVLCELAEVIKDELLNGNGVVLPDIGTLQLSVESIGAESPKDFTARNISRIVPKFRAAGSRNHQRNGNITYALSEGCKVRIVKK